LTTVLAAAIAWPIPAAARQAVRVPGAYSVTPFATHALVADGKASLLGLESDDAAAGAALTKALRKAAAKRGLSGGPDMSLVEMRLTMGCEGNAEACLTEGGKAIEVEQLVYGDLRKTGGSYKVSLYLLDVGKGSIASNTTVPLSAADLSPDKIDATATKIIQSLLPKETDDEVLPPTGDDTTPPEVEPDPDPQPEPEPRDRKYEWGLQKPIPKWKKVGLGVTAGVGGAAMIAGIAMQVVLSTKLRKDLLDEVDASADDDGDGILDVDDMDDPSTPMFDEANENNTISRGEKDLCKAARVSPMNDGNVTNAKVTEVCNVASGVQAGRTAAFVAGGVLLAGAVVFTILLFVHKKKGGAAEAMHRRDLRIGATPMPRGGFSGGVGFRF
jgi:hypothetical protein